MMVSKLYGSSAATLNNASDYRANGLGLGVQYSPLVRCIIKCNP